MRMNIETAETEDNYNVSRKAPVARREVELKKKCESRAKHIGHIASNREKVL
jgi:hypothetical protein